MSEQLYEIPDANLAVLILGWFAGMVRDERFPIKVREVVDEPPDFPSFLIVTESGLKYRVRVAFEGQG